MRYCLLALFLGTCFAGFCGQGLVKWKFLATHGSSQQFTLVVSGLIEPGWHLYAHTSEAKGLEGINLFSRSITVSQLNHPVSYTGKDEYEYKSWLECGINACNKTKPTDAVSINAGKIIDSKGRP